MKNKLTKIERNDTINTNKRSKEKKMQEILEGLNNKQYEAVTNYEGARAVEILENEFPASAERDALVALFDFIINREN